MRILLLLFLFLACGEKSNIDVDERLGDSLADASNQPVYTDDIWVGEFNPILTMYSQRLASPRFLNAGELPMRLLVYERNEDTGEMDLERPIHLDVLFNLKTLASYNTEYVGYTVNATTTCEVEIEPNSTCRKAELEVKVTNEEGITYSVSKMLEKENPRKLTLKHIFSVITEYDIRCWNLYSSMGKQYGLKYCAPESVVEDLVLYRWEVLTPSFQYFPTRDGSEPEILDLYLPSQIEGKNITYKDRVFLNFGTTTVEGLENLWLANLNISLEGEDERDSLTLIWEKWTAGEENE